MTALIICFTIIFCVVWLTTWAKHMAKCELPMFTYAECERTSDDDEYDEPTVEIPIGFHLPEGKTEEKTEEQMSDMEKMDRLLSDTASTVSALLRGEVDFDDIKN